MKKISIFLYFLVFSTLSYANSNLTLFETNSFLIKLQNNCEEGEVACNNISYSGVRKSDGAKINLKGKTLNRNCETSTCDAYGYEFTNGKYVYTIYWRGTPSLTITLNDKVILSEDGVFSSDISKFDTFVDVSKAKKTS